MRKNDKKITSDDGLFVARRALNYITVGAALCRSFLRPNVSDGSYPTLLYFYCGIKVTDKPYKSIRIKNRKDRY